MDQIEYEEMTHGTCHCYITLSRGTRQILKFLKNSRKNNKKIIQTFQELTRGTPLMLLLYH